VARRQSAPSAWLRAAPKLLTCLSGAAGSVVQQHVGEVVIVVSLPRSLATTSFAIKYPLSPAKLTLTVTNSSFERCPVGVSVT
jgi:hypothetical protein